MNQDEKLQMRYYVGIGASAGGVEALQELFRNMPVDTGASFIVVQHLSPDANSMMDKILRKTSKMEVKLAEEGMVLEPNQIYLNVPGMTLTVKAGRFHLEEAQNRNQLYMPINLMLNSLASDKEAHPIAVILSGSGSDGTLGIGAVKESGGVVIVQKPMEALYSSMPQSAIATGMVDLTESVSQIGMAIYDYLRNPHIQYIHQEDPIQSKETAELFDRIIDAVGRYSDIDFSAYKQNTIIRRIERRIAINRFHGMSEYLDYILSSTEEKGILYHDLLIGVTSFFRDEDAFLSLKENTIFPLIKQKRSIRLWSIACSTGEEAYSMAILISECMEVLHSNVEVKIFATDIDGESIAFAQKGVYSESALSCFKQEMVQKYFDKTDAGYIVGEKIRKMIVFAKHDIFKDAPFSRLDLITCRNMFIYVKPEMQQKAFASFYHLLNENGYLFLGSSESLGELDDAFIMIDRKWKIYQKREGYNTGYNGIFMISDLAQSPRRRDSREPAMIKKNIRSTSIFEKILFSMAGPAVLVDGYGKIVQIIQGGGRYLSLQDGQFDNSIDSCFVSSLAILLNHIIVDLEKSGTNSIENNVTGLEDYPNETLNIHVSRFELDEGDYYLIQIRETENAPEPEHQEQKETLDLRKLKDSRIRKLENELSESSWNLKLAVEESESRNEELQATNEELLASNEELQSTNEEMQSVNEELYTINAEYQNKIVELTTANADFDNLLLNAEVGALYIDENMCIRKITPIMLQNTNLMPTDIERPVIHINFLDSYKDFIQDVGDVARNGKIVEKETTDHNNVTWLVRIRPYYENSQKAGGVLVTMFDITKRLDAAKFELKRLTDSVPGGVLRMRYDAELVIDYANDSFYAMTGYSPDEVREKFHNRYNRIVLSEDWDLLKEKLGDLKMTGQVLKAEYRIIRKDRSTLWNSIQAVLFRDKDVIELQCIIMDISLIKAYEQQMKKERDYYNALYQNVVCGIVQYENMDNTLYCYDANVEAVRMLGYSSMEEFRSQQKQTLPDVSYAEDIQEIANRLLSLKKEGECINFEHRIIRKNGEIGWVSGAAKMVASPTGKLLIQSTFMDVTEEKKALHQLKKERDQYDRLYSMLYNMAVCGIVQADVVNETILNVNKEALQILGQKNVHELERKIFGKEVSVSGESSLLRIGKVLHRMDNDTRRKSVKLRLDLEDRHITLEGSTDSIFEDTDSKVVQFTFLDVTEREGLKEAKMELAVAMKANEAKSEFLSKMSHEIRTPMNGIVGMIDSAMLYIHSEERVMQCLNKMKSSMSHLQRLVNDVLDLAKIESGKMSLEIQQFNLKDLIDDIIEEFSFYANERGVGLSQAGSYTQRDVLSDPMRLREILGNLISNALKFTNTAGWVILIVEEKRISNEEREITFRVKDSGCGISEATQEHIFEAFEQGDGAIDWNRQGSGLGLPICKSLVELLGGNLTVTSKEGEGSEFSFAIPMSLAKEKRIAPRTEGYACPSYKGHHVLLAEDNQLNAEIAETFLETCEFEVDVVENGKKALRKFIKEPENYYSLILLDIQMPVMDGNEAAAAIRASDKGYAKTVPILAMSANAFTEDVQKSLDAGMNGHLAKPVDMQTLIRTIAGFLAPNHEEENPKSLS